MIGLATGNWTGAIGVRELFALLLLLSTHLWTLLIPLLLAPYILAFFSSFQYFNRRLGLDISSSLYQAHLVERLSLLPMSYGGRLRLCAPRKDGRIEEVAKLCVYYRRLLDATLASAAS